MGRKVILLELNEVPPRIFEEFGRWRSDSFLVRRRGELRFFRTICEDDRPLSPWITWPSLHRGVKNTRHGIRHLGQDLAAVDRSYPPIWKILCSSGVPTGVFGSLHSYPLPEDAARYCFYVPDTYAAGPACHPDPLEVFQELNLSMARESARNVSSRIPWKAAGRFAIRAPGLGLRTSTAIELTRHLLEERWHPWLRVRRRTYQTVLAFDLFFAQLERTRPAFCTFFTNHVASSMHRYWAARFPEDYESSEYDAEWVERYSGEIQFCMEHADAEIARLASFAERNPEYVLLVTSSMGQGATKARVVRTQTYLSDVDRFMTRLGFGKADWELRAAMAPDVNVQIRPERIAGFRGAVGRLQVNGSPVQLDERGAGFFNVVVSGVNAEDLPPFASLADEQIPFEEIGLANVEIEDRAGSNAQHIPEGSLLVFDPRSSHTTFGGIPCPRWRSRRF